MRKIVIHRPGGFNKLTIESCPDPVPEPDEVIVETKTVGVNFADCFVRMGLYASAKTYVGWPVTPGFEFSGLVSAVGKNVTRFAAGERVFGVTRFNAYATHVLAPQEQLFSLPETISFEKAGCFPAIYLTAYYALYMAVRIYADSIILVHSAAGGVGSALLQLCKLAGWRTIGVVGSPHKIEQALAMGADVVIDKSSQDLWREVERHAPEGVDVVLDGNGAETLKKGYQHLKQTGKLISYGFHSMFPKGRGIPNPVKLAYDYLRTPRFNPVEMHKQNVSLVTFNLSYLFERTDMLTAAMDYLYPNFCEGRIQMPQITVYPFDDVAKAHRDLQSGLTSGKLALAP